MNDENDTELKSVVRRVKIRRVPLKEVIDSIKKENAQLTKKISQRDHKLKEIRVASGRITGLTTGVLQDNK